MFPTVRRGRNCRSKQTGFFSLFSLSLLLFTGADYGGVHQQMAEAVWGRLWVRQFEIRARGCNRQTWNSSQASPEDR